MKAGTTEQRQYAVNIYTMKAHIVKAWKSYEDRKYVAFCGRAAGGNSSFWTELPETYDLCSKCADKANG